MTILLSRIVPRAQLVAVHAPLGEVEWEGVVPHVEATLPAGVPLIMAPVSSGKSLLDHVEERGKFPGIRQRWCTATHKRGPIERELRRHLKANPRFGGRLVNCLGIRRDESAARARRVPWRRNERLSVAGREVFDWLPIFDLSTEDVFRVIRAAGQSPHWIYRHLSRCSCSFCIFSSPEDLRRAAELRLSFTGATRRSSAASATPCRPPAFPCRNSRAFLRPSPPTARTRWISAAPDPGRSRRSGPSHGTAASSLRVHGAEQGGCPDEGSGPREGAARAAFRQSGGRR